MTNMIQATTHLNQRSRTVLLDVSATPYRIEEQNLESEKGRNVKVWGYDSSKLTSTFIDCPENHEIDLTSIIKSQLEVKYPYIHERLFFDWRPFYSKALVLAEEQSKLKAFSDELQREKVEIGVLNAEAVARAFVELETIQNAILLWHHDKCVEIIYIEHAQVAHLKNLQLTHGDLNHSVQRDHLAEDLKVLIKQMVEVGSIPIYGISDHPQNKNLFQNPEIYELDIQSPKFEKAKECCDLSGQELISFLPSIGMALLVHHQDKVLNLFRHIRQEREPNKKEGGSYKGLAATLLACCALFFINLFVSYQNDLKTLASLQFDPEFQQTIQDFQSTQDLKKKILEERPDLLHLIDILSPKEIKGISLDQLIFKKGQTAKIVARTKNEMHFKYIEALQKNKSLSQVKLVTPSYDKVKKETTFTVTFEYQKWNRKPSLNPFAQYGN